MNFLAHIHIASYCDSNIAGNLLGDFVKGNPVGRYPADIVSGILLHRFVDSYTDRHKNTLTAKTLFHPSRRRFASIAMDLFWDHCLATQWCHYHSQSLEKFCKETRQQAEQTESSIEAPFPERYRNVITAMWQGNWLLSYQDMNKVELALQKMSLRTPRMAPLANCFLDIEAKYDQLILLFPELYQDVLKASLQYVQSKV